MKSKKIEFIQTILAFLITATVFITVAAIPLSVIALKFDYAKYFMWLFVLELLVMKVLSLIYVKLGIEYKEKGVK